MSELTWSIPLAPKAAGGSTRAAGGRASVCVPECPVEAIYSEDEIPAGQEQYLALNEELSQIWPVITEMKDPPADADDWREVKDKLQYLER